MLKVPGKVSGSVLEWEQEKVLVSGSVLEWEQEKVLGWEKVPEWVEGRVWKRVSEKERVVLRRMSDRRW